MNNRRLELLITVSFGLAAGIALFIVSIRAFAPESWPIRRWVAYEPLIEFLTALANVSGGLIVIIFIAVLLGGVIMSLIFSGIDKYRAMKERDRLIREEALKEGRQEGLEQGLEQGIERGLQQGRSGALAEVRSLLRAKGYDPDEILEPEETESP